MKEHSNRSPQSPESEAALEGWKEIATYLQRDVTTAKRWEKNEALPALETRITGRELPGGPFRNNAELREVWEAARELPLRFRFRAP